MRASTFLLLLGSAATAAACSKSPASPASADDSLPCDVDAVLVSACQQCHGPTPAFGAPMSLVTYADLHAPSVTDPSTPVYQMVETRIHDATKPMPQPPNPALSSSQSATIDSWVAAGAPSGGGGSCNLDAGGDASSGNLNCTPDVTLRPTSAWAMPSNETDVYVCYGVDVPVTGTRQVIGFQPHVDNTNIVHHMLLYESPTSVSGTPTPCSSTGVSVKNPLLYGWAPGGQAFELPAVAGYPMSTAGVQHFMVQVHYSNIKGLTDQTDETGFDLCTTADLRPNDAAVVAFGSMSFTIPAHGTLDITCDIPLPTSGPMNVISAFPHMHLLGTTIETNATPAGDAGPSIPLGGVADWSFTNQIWFPMTETVNPGAVVHTRCAWNNVTAEPVSWGEYTEDEMCYSFTMYYPADPGIKSWLLPSLESTCRPTK